MANQVERFSDIQEAATAGLQTMELLVRVLSGGDNSSSSSTAVNFREATDFTVASFKQVISMLNRTGHARFRRAPVEDSVATAAQCPVVESPPAEKAKTAPAAKRAKISPATELSTSQHSSTSFLSSITAGDGGDRSVTNGKLGQSLPPPPPVPSGKPPIPVPSGKPPIPVKKRCHNSISGAKAAGKTNSACGSCHCHKESRKKSVKTIRVAAISSKVADIPQDDYLWRKYGQKPIKGSPFPRGYYRCSGDKDCAAKKCVERAKDDPTMLDVTYKFEHSHARALS